MSRRYSLYIQKQTSLPEFQLRHNLCHNPPRLIFAEQTAREAAGGHPVLDLHQTQPNQMPCFTVREGPSGEKSYDEVDRLGLCFDVGVTGTGYATRTPPSAGRDCRSSPRSMWSGDAHGEWYLRANARPSCRKQVRSRSDLLIVLANNNTARPTLFQRTGGG
jgi:hypothetical protein